MKPGVERYFASTSTYTFKMKCCVAALWVSALTTLAVAAGEEHSQPAQPQNDNELELSEEEKRAWTNLHGGWGKRGWQDMSSAWGKRAWNDLNSAWGKRAWQDLNSAWGKRGWQDMSSAWGKRAWKDLSASPWGKRGWQDMSSAWGKRGWNDMSSAWGKRAWNDLNSAWGKRGWQDMSSAWGKRGWQDMSSAWGKRQPEKWSQFHGAWGKRSSEPDYEDYEAVIDQLVPEQQASEGSDTISVPVKKAAPSPWNSLHGVWGKRPAKPQFNNGAYYWKREPGWTNLRGMWGKRSYWEPSQLSEDNEDAAKDEA